MECQTKAGKVTRHDHSAPVSNCVLTNADLTAVSFGELRDRLKARADELNHTDDLELMAALRYLTALAERAHTPDSVDALTQLARIFFFGAQPVKALQTASLAAQLASGLDLELSLCEARGVEGLALSDLGRFTESTVAHAESWRLARRMANAELEGWAIKRVGDLWAAMAQFDVAITYLSRSRELAAECGLLDLELCSRNNIANCAVQLRDPAAGLRALLPLPTEVPETKMDVLGKANANDTLGHLYLLSGDLEQARVHAQESGRLAKIAGVERTIKRNEALLGLIDVRFGVIERGLAAVESALVFAERVDQIDVADCLSMCADAHEAAGQSDKALEYLKQLADWKKKSIVAEMPLQYEGFADCLQLRTGTPVSDEALLVRSQRLETNVQQRVQYLVETAINAEVASGHDLYRTFRVAKLASSLATAIGWSEKRVSALALGGQLCNIGMMAIPARILQKKRGLSDSEVQVMRAHTQYGAELLRKSKLRMLDVAAIVAEQHHERYNGSGYPLGLSGEAIADEARIMSVCDAFDAMTHRRPWRTTPLSAQAALNEIRRGAGSKFDPQVANAFVEFIRREFWEHDDFDAFLAEGAYQHEYVRVRARMETLIAHPR